MACPLPPGMELWYETTRVKSIAIHHKCRDSLYQVLTNIWKHARTEVKKTAQPPDDIKQDAAKLTAWYDVQTRAWLHAAHLDRFSGSFNFRLIRGSTEHLSGHAFGAAVDWNASENPLGSHKTTLPSWWVRLWKDAGWTWGGDFKSRPDPMHVQMFSGY